MKNIYRRLEILEELEREQQKLRELERLKHMPYIFFAPSSIIKDSNRVEYYPTGKCDGAEFKETMTMQKFFDFLSNNPNTYVQVSMSICLEWIYILHVSRNNEDKDRPHYTQEQIDRVTTKWLSDNPELLYLEETEEGLELKGILERLPQDAIVLASKWLEKMKESEV